MLSEVSSSNPPAVLGTDIDISMAEVMRDETKSLQLSREILRIWSKQNKVKYVPPAFRGSLKYKRWKVNYTGIYVDNPRPRIILNREHWKSFATVTMWKLNLLTLAHEFVHHMQFSRSGMKHDTAFPSFEFGKEHCKRKFEGEAKETSRMMTDQIVHRIESGEISLLPRDGVFGEAGLWAAELLRAQA